jgi:hypothetical protein
MSRFTPQPYSPARSFAGLREIRARFRYSGRTVFKSFEVWGWQFAIERPIQEFINLTNVSCDSLTLRGTGVVTVTVPKSCGTGRAGSNVVTVDLGPSTPVNEPVALGLCASYGNTETVALEPLPEPALGGLFAGAALVVLLGRRRRGPPIL